MVRGKENHRKGFVLVVSLLLSSILVLIALPYISRVVSEYILMTKIYSSTAALDVAEAGLERALWEISYNNCAFPGWTSTTDAGGNQIKTINVNGFRAVTGEIMGDYTTTVTISADGMTTNAVSIGYVPNRVLYSGKRRIAVAYSKHNFTKAVAVVSAGGNITMSGQAKTDGYDSSLGTYASQPHTADGDVVTNGSINLSGNAYINGDANPGVDHPFTGTPNVSGSYGTLQAPVTAEPIPPATISGAASANNNGNLTVTSGGITSPYTGGLALSVSGSNILNMPGGIYYFTSISVSGQASINVTGTDANPTIIYVDGGNVSISGQGIVNNGRPRDLQLYSTGSSISLSGQATFVGAIYAPTAAVTLTGQENLYGSIICGSNVDSGQAQIHFDKDLLSVTPVFASNRASSWQDLKG